MTMTQEEIDALIQSGDLEAEAEKLATPGDPGPSEQAVGDADFGEMDKDTDTIYSPLDPKLELLYDLQLPVSIELGRTNMLVRNILRLGRGSVIEFDKLVSEPVDILINGKKVAEGEVVVIDKHFGIRVTTLVDPSERLRGMK
jgi:flagellar motor switch protein FliN